MLTLLLSTAFLSVSIALGVSVMRNIQYMEKIDEIEESLQTAIEILDEQYKIIDKKTKIEVFSDEPIIRELVRDITVARNSVLGVAKLLDDTINIESPQSVEE